MRGLKDYYLHKHPGSESMARLLEMTEIADSARATGRRASLHAFVLTAAAAAVACVVTLSNGDPRQIKAAAVVEEIALQHEQDLAVELIDGSYDELSRYMSMLDFEPVESERLQSEARLVGGRYCSIRGCLAAQLRLETPDGEVHTLYQARWQPKFADLLNRAVTVDGVRVEFWREHDVLFGLASRVRPPG